MSWLGSKLCLASKNAFTGGLTFFNLISRSHFKEPKYPQLKSFSKILRLIGEIEPCGLMRRRWNNLDNLLVLLCNEDSAYFMRLLFALNLACMEPEKYRMSPGELALYWKELTLQGYPDLANKLWDHTEKMYEKAGVDFGEVCDRTVKKIRA